jgi:hypothetical protein
MYLNFCSDAAICWSRSIYISYYFRPSLKKYILSPLLYFSITPLLIAFLLLTLIVMDQTLYFTPSDWMILLFVVGFGLLLFWIANTAWGLK